MLIALFVLCQRTCYTNFTINENVCMYIRTSRQWCLNMPNVSPNYRHISFIDEKSDPAFIINMSQHYDYTMRQIRSLYGRGKLLVSSFRSYLD